MKKHVLFVAVTFAITLYGSVASATLTTWHSYLTVANDAGVRFGGTGTAANSYSTINDYNYYGTGGGAYATPGITNLNNTYLIKADGGGLNELGISTTTNTSQTKQATSIATTSSSPSGTFYLTNTGGRGADDDLILMLALTGPVSDNFSVHIQSSGYSWTAAAPGAYQPPTPTDATWGIGVNETFTKSDLIYGPQTYKPGTASNGTQQALYIGQNMADASTAAYIMFIDLYVGNLKSTALPNLTNNGAAQVDFSFSGIDSATKIAFNAFGWTSAAFQGEGISWTNDTRATSAVKNGYTIDVAPVPIPPAAFLFGSGLSGMFFLRRRKITA